MSRHLLLAVLLASAACLAAAQDGLISTATYKCDPSTCQLPECQCASNSPPGGLTPDQIPQFVLVSHDNALDGLPYKLVQGILGKKEQSNGCPVPVTWFAMFYHSDCNVAQDAIAKGDEVAMQTNRFDPTDPFTATDPAPKYDSRDPKTGKPSVEIEITMSRKHWHDVCNISYSNMVGFRAPNYYNNPPIRKALAKNGYLYDSTIIERWYTNSPTSPSQDRVLWPYTMDAGIPQECGFMGPTVGKCQEGEEHEGLWEVPLYQAQEGETMYGVGSLGDTEAGLPAISDMTQFLKDQLDGHLKNGRTPMQLSMHYGWLTNREDKVDPSCSNAGCELYPNDNAKAVGKFLDYALKQEAVRFVTYSDFIRWMQDPVPLDKFDEWIDCKTPGVKADLSAVKLTDEQKSDAYYLRKMEEAVAAASPAPAPVAAPTPATSEEATPEVTQQPSQTEQQTETEQPVGGETTAPAPVEVPKDGAATLGKAAVAAAAVLAAALLAL